MPTSSGRPVSGSISIEWATSASPGMFPNSTASTTVASLSMATVLPPEAASVAVVDAQGTSRPTVWSLSPGSSCLAISVCE